MFDWGIFSYMDINKSKILFALFFLMTISGARAEAESAKDLSVESVGEISAWMTVDNAIEIALHQSYRMAMARQTMAEAKAEWDKNRSDYTFKESLRYDTEKSIDKPANGIDNETTQQEIKYTLSRDVLTGERLGGKLTSALSLSIAEENASLNSVDSKNYNAGPSIDFTYKQPLTGHGREANLAAMTMADYRLKIADSEFDLEQERLIYEITNSFFNVIKEKELIKLLKENVKVTQRQLEKSRVQARLGNIAEIEVSKLEVQLGRDENALLNAERRYKSTNEQLLLDIGYKGERVMAHTPAKIEKQSIEIGLAFQLAEGNRKELKVIEFEIDSLRSQLSQTKSTDDPTLTLSAGYRHGSSSDKYSDIGSFNEESWNVLMSVEYPFDNHGRSDAESRSVNAKITKLQISKKRQADDIHKEIRDAYRDIDSSIKTYKILDRAAKLSEENLNIDELRFNKGVISSDDLMRTQNESLQIKVDRFNALIDFEIAQVKLYYSMGRIKEYYL